MRQVDRTELAAEIRAAATRAPRILVALAGPPASGKSTQADELAHELADAVVLPMDGFHLDNAPLVERNLFERKGAPETFDLEGFRAVLGRVKVGGAVAIPTFDRAEDRVVADGGVIPADARIVLVEGNYLLLDRPGWRDLRDLWDVSVYLDVPEPELESRLIRRWLDHGLSREQATRRAQENDIVNAGLVRKGSVGATMVVSAIPAA